MVSGDSRVKRILADILVVYSYGVWVVLGAFVVWGLPVPFASLPGWAIGFVFYFRYLRAEIGAGAEGDEKVL